MSTYIRGPDRGRFTWRMMIAIESRVRARMRIKYDLMPSIEHRIRMGSQIIDSIFLCCAQRYFITHSARARALARSLHINIVIVAGARRAVVYGIMMNPYRASVL